MWALKFLVPFACAFCVFSDELVGKVMDESEIDKSLSENIVLYGIISELVSHSSNISSICTSELVNVFRSINNQEMWAIKGSYFSFFLRKFHTVHYQFKLNGTEKVLLLKWHWHNTSFFFVNVRTGFFLPISASHVNNFFYIY